MGMFDSFLGKGRNSTRRWTARTSGATEDYTRGIKNPRRSWGKTTCESADCYKAGVDVAHSRGAYKKGVKKTGSRGWSAKTLLKGPQRFAQGTADAGNTYAKGFGPYHRLIPSIFMPKRFPRGDPRNINRVSAVSNAMGILRTSIAGADDKTCPSK